MYVNVNCRVPIARENESDFLVPILVDILAPGKFSADPQLDEQDSEYIVGRLWAERLEWNLAQSLGYHPVAVCDAASATWLEVYETIINKRGTNFRRDLELDAFVNDLVFVHEALVHPEIDDRLAVLDAAISSIASPGALELAHHEQALPHHLEDWEYRDLGFKKIARSNLLMRDNRCRYPFAEEFAAGRAVDFEATAEHEEWLLEQWSCLVADHPAM